MIRKHRLFGLLLFLVIIILPQICEAKRPVTIGVTLGLTGRYAKLGEMQKKAYYLWETQVNKRGGLLGRPVKIVIYDDKSDKNEARSLYERMITEEKVDLLLGPYSSGITGAVLPVTEKHRYPLLLGGAASDALYHKGYKNIFGVFSPASRYSVGFLEMIAMNGLTKIGIVHANDLFSQSAAKGTEQWGKKFGLDILFNISFAKGEHDLTHLALKAKEEKVQVLIVCGHFDEAVDMRKALAQIKWYPGAYFATIGPAVIKYKELLADDATYTFTSAQWSTEIAYTPGDAATFLEPFRATYKHEPVYQAAIAYAACQILEAAINKAGSFDREILRATLAELDTTSIIGRYGVDHDGLQLKHFPITTQRLDGKIKVVWPETLATSQPSFHLQTE